MLTNDNLNCHFQKGSSDKNILLRHFESNCGTRELASTTGDVS